LHRGRDHGWGQHRSAIPCSRVGRRDRHSSSSVGSGTRMFENINNEQIQLEPFEVINTPQATHLRIESANNDHDQTEATRRP
jgi:hypothetical protein